MPHLREVLATLRANTTTKVAQGQSFERACLAFLRRDPGMQQQFQKAWQYADWAKQAGHPSNDTGIDLVAETVEGGLCAIQCKFYEIKHTISQQDITGFIALAKKLEISRLIFFDTTEQPWGKNAANLLDEEQVRITVDRMDETIDWRTFVKTGEVLTGPRKQPRQHQKEALEAVRTGLAEADRGKLVMACGTGKTYTGLIISEALAGPGKRILFLVPSLSLMSQSIREWSIDTTVPLRLRAVCSDTEVGMRRAGKDDEFVLEAPYLDTPATTHAGKLAASLEVDVPDRMTVVFATYQSLQAVAAAQKQYGLSQFDLILCDEAHRTTGVILPGETGQQSNFVMVHDQRVVRGSKRLYMTATPRVYGDAAKSKAGEASVELCSMDDEALFGRTLFERGFGWAVENGLLTDYKVIVLAVDERIVSDGLQARLADGNNELKLDDATKIVGCYRALTKMGIATGLGNDAQPMHRALAFCKDIRSSKLVMDEFAPTIADFLGSEEGRAADGELQTLDCEVRHVDGTFAATERTKLLTWLQAPAGPDQCRILTNARCLSEGVDVPALDAILYLHPRKSEIDVVQSVGRVMRRAEGKQMGYVILPIGIPAGVEPEDALDDNERYQVVWQVLNALRSHDERLEAVINKIDLGESARDKIEVIGIGAGTDGPAEDGGGKAKQVAVTSSGQGAFVFDDVSKAIMAKIVKRCGKRDYWDKWAVDIAKIADAHKTRIKTVVTQEGTPAAKAFADFLSEIKRNLNDNIMREDAIEMLAQHLITRPVFEALFEGQGFVQRNPVSQAMEAVLAELDEHSLDKEAATLDKFYESVRRRAAGTETGAAKQRLVTKLYEEFFRGAFPRTAARLGIVYTPDQIVDYILHSVDDVLRSEFGMKDGIGSEGVHVLDPFVGTGTFMVRLLRSGLLTKKQIAAKYGTELHAGEIVLLAYYIAAINIEATYHDMVGGEYRTFDGICLTDSFEASDDLLGLVRFGANYERIRRQRKVPIQVIVGNPPYSIGQESGNDNNPNVAYPAIDSRIEQTYAAQSEVHNMRSIYDSYVRAIRWASDRIKDKGVIGFVTNAGFLDSTSADGLRKCLAKEFSSLYVINLRGNQRTSGEMSRREGGKIFGSGSRAPIAISILVRNPTSSEHGVIHYHDIGDYLTREEKLARLTAFQGIAGVESAQAWSLIQPDKHGDWLRQRDSAFDLMYPLHRGNATSGIGLFTLQSAPVKTNRDAWCYNFSRNKLWHNIIAASDTYNKAAASRNPSSSPGKSFSWCGKTVSAAQRGKPYLSDQRGVRPTLYRPFTRSWLYFDHFLNWSTYKIPQVFPSGDSQNRVICLQGAGGQNDFSVLIADVTPDYCYADMRSTQCFPYFTYDRAAASQGALDADQAAGRSTLLPIVAITDCGLTQFQNAYPDESITKEDIFYYVYGVLHSPEYRVRYADTLRKVLACIPLVKTVAVFRAFVRAGRDLGDLHLAFEHQDPWPGVKSSLGQTDPMLTKDEAKALYRVEKMRFAGKRPNLDRRRIVYNAKITIEGIPLDAYDYVVNGKPALDWVMERQTITTDKDSGIVNDANDYANETMNDPAYPLKLLLSVITVSMRTMEIVRGLPPLEIMEAVPTRAASATLEITL